MKIDLEFLSLIEYNGTLNQKQFDILGIKKDDENNWKNLAVLQDITKNNKNLLMLLKGIKDLGSQEQVIKNYHMVLQYNNIEAKVYKSVESKKTNSDILQIFCDGASKGNPGNSGSGVVIFYKNQNPTLLYGDFKEEATNNIAELTALLKALKIASLNITENKITIYADSKYAIDCISTWAYSWKRNGWSKKGGEIKNLDIIIEAHELYLKIKDSVILEHIKGHSGNIGNELADIMANISIKERSIEYKEFVYKNLNDVLKIKI
ncbi:ribonuclease HI [Aliarcobacter trophiarum LMG 25534]|uniref:ribonuclease H n=1 Tax=Aliarcobacter trophiarum LMG 25534 TaxID=1032241 RepID=A0AAD0VMF5_9BACT|nr:ribonuclease H [Aliarcobacter trophiarum]AXK49174.1 ribonuclease HI [Aliarcobacter trophiarum LMG 25534]RXI25499.1 ribonuclease HI [Aliarcobacter trophiarum]RXJ89805.1 ribonuclease HI [Aliarcobacter trophiarum LMG 25534]